jgi:hypothetical protein
VDSQQPRVDKSPTLLANPRMGNHLYYGDNLDILRSSSIADESVDLVYLSGPAV